MRNPGMPPGVNLSALVDRRMTMLSSRDFSANPWLDSAACATNLPTIVQSWLRFPKQLWGQLASEDLVRAVEELIQRHGQVWGVVKRMEEMGLGSVAHSWVGSDVSQPIFSDQLHALFGTSVLRALAAKLDLQPRDFVRHLSQALPRAMNRLAETANPTASDSWHGNYR